MPPREYYFDWWYEDLPEGVKQAAAAMGYVDKAHWDETKPVGFDAKPFSELSLVEKRAAWFVGLNVIDKKLDIYWDEADEETKKAALAIGFNKETWDDDWRIEDFPIEHKNWADLTEEERAGAEHFGYTRIIWDETGETEWDGGDAPATKLNSGSTEEEKKEEVEDSVEHSEEEEVTDSEGEDDEAEPKKEEEAPKPKKEKKKKKARFAVSKMVGGDGGDAFDDRNHRRVRKITLFSNGKIVSAIQMSYEGGAYQKHGEDDGKEHSLELKQGEWVNQVTVRHAKVVQELTFETNKGNKLHAGGKGGALGLGLKAGDEQTFRAPTGLQLCGIKGRADDSLTAIAFRWGSVPGSARK